jgi:hypothetical protein
MNTSGVDMGNGTTGPHWTLSQVLLTRNRSDRKGCALQLFFAPAAHVAHYADGRVENRK